MNSYSFRFQKKKVLHRASRVGLILPAVVVCLIFSAMVVANVLKATTAQARQVVHFEQRLQLQILVDDALEHGLYQLVRDPTYQGEQWDISEEDWNLGQKGSVKISIIKEQSGARIISTEGTLLHGTEILQKITRTNQL